MPNVVRRGADVVPLHLVVEQVHHHVRCMRHLVLLGIPLRSITLLCTRARLTFPCAGYPLARSSILFAHCSLLSRVLTLGGGVDNLGGLCPG